MDEVTAGEPRRRRYAQLSSRRPWIVFIVILLLIGLVWGAYALIHGTKAGGPGAFGRRGGRPPTTVGIAYANTADVPVTLDALGTVTPTATVTVRPQVSGVITRILFREGQMVRRGQTLAVIDPRPLQMALEQSQGQLTRDEAQLANAQLTLGRYRTLLAQDSIARQDVDTQAATVKQLEGVVLTDKAALGTAQLNLGYSRVTAPVNGRVGLRAVDVGNLISAGDANGLVVLTSVAPIDVEFTVPQDEVPAIVRRSAHAVLPVAALDRTRTTQLAQGTFSTLDNQVDPTTGTVRAKARFANTDGALFPNQFVNVRMTLDTLHNAVVVPITAVRTGPNGDYVWLVQPNQTVTMQPIKRGQTTATQAVILSGLSRCERVVTEGGDRLTQGGRVVLPGQNPFAGFAGRGGRGGGGRFAAFRGRGGQHGAGGRPGGFGGHPGAGGAAGGYAGPSMPAPPPGCPAAPAVGLGGHGRPTPGGSTPAGQAPAALPAPAQAEAPTQSQSAGSGFGGGPTGGFTPSPQMLAARQAMRQACGADLQRLCPDMQGREAFMCLRQKAGQASAACQAAMSQMRRRGPDGGAPAGGG